MKKSFLQLLTFALVFLIGGMSVSFAQVNESPGYQKKTSRNAQSNITYLNAYIYQPDVEKCLISSVIFDIRDINGTPVPDAIVSFNGVENTPGDYIFEGIGKGMYYYSIIKEGYERINDELMVTLESSEQTVGITLLIETFTIAFNILDTDGNAVSDAVVTFNNLENNTGDYVFSEVEAGNYAYKIEKEWYFPIEGEVEVANDTTINITLVAQQFTITFIILDAIGNEISDAFVTFNGQQNNAGDYIFDGIKAGNYEYSVKKAGYFTFEGVHQVAGDSTLIVNLAVETFTVAFKIMDKHENDISDAVISFNGIKNEAGDYVFEGIKAGTYDYLVERTGYLPMDGQHTVTRDTTIRITLSKESYIVTFNIVDVHDFAIPNAVITFNGVKNTAGLYIFEGIKAGTYSYKVEKEAYKSFEGQADVVNQDLIIKVALPDSTTATTNLLNEQWIKIIPNPNTGKFTIEFHGNAAEKMICVTVLDPTGKVVFRTEQNSQEASFTKEFDLSFLSGGIYFIRLQDSHRTEVEKLIINQK